MKKKIGVIIIVLIAVLHVHLNMYTVENTLNPSFWIYLIFDSPPFGGYLSQIISDLFVLGIQCFVTSYFAILILKWNRKWIWFFSFSACIIGLILVRDCNFALILGSHFQLCYFNIYHYDAWGLILKYAIFQIIYILMYLFVIRICSNQSNLERFSRDQGDFSQSDHSSNQSEGTL